MKLKLLIALVAVPSLVIAQPNVPTVGSTGQPGGFQPLPSATPGQVGATQQQTATNPNKATGSTAATDTSVIPANTAVGGKADGHGSSNKATVKGSSQGSTYTNPCSSARTCN